MQEEASKKDRCGCVLFCSELKNIGLSLRDENIYLYCERVVACFSYKGFRADFNFTEMIWLASGLS